MKVLIKRRDYIDDDRVGKKESFILNCLLYEGAEEVTVTIELLMRVTKFSRDVVDRQLKNLTEFGYITISEEM